MALRLQRYASRVPAGQRVPELDEWLGIGAGDKAIPGLDAKLDALYAGSKLGDEATRLQLWKADKAAIDASGDAALQFAAKVMPAILRLEDEDEARSGRIQALRPQFMQAMIDFNASQGKPVYPDANSSLRITFGTVRGYSPRDAVQMMPFTTLAGIVDKDTGVEPFDAPKAQLEAIAAGKGAQYRMESLGDVPVNFLSDVDTTGGNSGSPTLNAKGELVGLLVDGNYESLSAGWIFNPELTRSIHVDARYMRWAMDEVDHAERLLEEMGLPHDWQEDPDRRRRPCSGHLHGRRADARRRCGWRRHVAAVAAAGHRRPAARRRLQGRPRRAGRPDEAADERRGIAGRLHRELRFARGPGGHQPPLRPRRDPAQLDARGQPARERLHRRRPRRGAFRRPGRAGAGDGRLRQGHRPHPRRCTRQDRPRVLRRGGRRGFCRGLTREVCVA